MIVSNNERNRRLGDVLGARTTTAPKPDMPSIVAFDPGEVSEEQTSVVADDVWLLRKEWLVRRVGGLAPAQMRRVDDALRAALDLG